MANKSKNNRRSLRQTVVARHVFTQNGTVFLRSAQNLEMNEWSAINFYWMPVLKLEKELGT